MNKANLVWRSFCNILNETKNAFSSLNQISVYHALKFESRIPDLV